MMVNIGYLGLALVSLVFAFYIWRRRQPAGKKCLELMEQLIPLLRKAPLSKMEDAYIEQVLQRFKPQSYQKISKPLTQVLFHAHEFMVPSLNGQSHYVFNPQLSGEPYTADDVGWTEMILYIAREVEASKRQRWIGVQEERQRIRRDLHDELTQDLIALMRSSKDECQYQLALSAMGSLRSILSALSDEENTLESFLVTAQAQMRERLLLHGFALEWYEKNIASDIVVSSKEVSNVLKVLKELGCNILKHAEMDKVKVVVNQFGGQLEVRVENKVKEHKVLHESNQLGMMNIETRVQELSGKLTVQETPNEFVVVFSFPLEGAWENANV